ncbi:YbjQ family protein [Halomonas urmiana]|uniref:YbjQ family protein n=1 Tax=Halomonas urmiana TaxID=490901 RepID=A0A5R8MHS8_9GAMM|nr:heavy metal-binding domain-containing protein [Halomonas urmiana]TLF50749.1 YbjQ family protein [Halomonas urmiana]
MVVVGSPAATEGLDALRRETESMGANAVIGIDLDYSEISGGGKSMLILVATGTAVKVTRD